MSLQKNRLMFQGLAEGATERSAIDDPELSLKVYLRSFVSIPIMMILSLTCLIMRVMLKELKTLTKTI